MDLIGFLRLFGGVVHQLVKQKAHVDLTLSLRDGQIKFVRIDRTYLPQNLPNVLPNENGV